MLDGLFMLLGLSVVMALASFLAGALPLSMTLSSSQLRLISTIGMGVLVGTSLVVIIPEGIEAVYTAGEASGLHTRSLSARTGEMRWVGSGVHRFMERDLVIGGSFREVAIPKDLVYGKLPREELPPPPSEETSTPPSTETPPPSPNKETSPPAHGEEHHDPPTFYIGFSLILGFILMFLIDKLPRHAQEHIQPPPATRHISLDNLSQGLHSSPHSPTADSDSESFLQSLAPTPKQTRSLATTTGLVIHAAADGIAMGASATSSNTKLGFIIFIAIMIHKAPAAFGLTSVLLKQGLSKRAARGHLIIFSLAAPVGALGTWVLVSILGGDHMEGERGQWWTGMLLLFSAGTFLYVAMHAMQEDSIEHTHSQSNGYTEINSQRKQQKPQMRDTLAAVGGMLIPLLTQLGHHH
ncbi:ZIP metal ion transporter-like protein [Rhexocercosporidium sp. MPI-PUGE-AT-0058]|nr:ZIP metal ion transporter-like protein [Rhexocercosporidium sp. MPI-PUGE-AT-0058]